MFTAVVLPGPSKAGLRRAQPWAPSPCGVGLDGAHGSSRRLRGAGLVTAIHGALHGALCLPCLGDSSGAALHEPGAAAHPDPWHRPCSPPHSPPCSHTQAGEALAVGALGGWLVFTSVGFCILLVARIAPALCKFIYLYIFLNNAVELLQASDFFCQPFLGSAASPPQQRDSGCLSC